MLMIVYRRECEPVLLIQIMVILDKVYCHLSEGYGGGGKIVKFSWLGM